jgi:hypothetical protein
MLHSKFTASQCSGFNNSGGLANSGLLSLHVDVSDTIRVCPSDVPEQIVEAADDVRQAIKLVHYHAEVALRGRDAVTVLGPARSDMLDNLQCLNAPQCIGRG